MSFLVCPGRSPEMMLLCLSACSIYNTLSISNRSGKKKLGSCSISFLAHPGRSRCMMLLCLSVSRIYNTLNISIRSRKKKKSGYCSISFLVHPGISPFWFAHLEVLPWCYYAWALLKYIRRLAFLSVPEKKNYAFVLYPFCFTQVEVSAWCYYVWAVLGYITSL